MLVCIFGVDLDIRIGSGKIQCAVCDGSIALSCDSLIDIFNGCGDGRRVLGSGTKGGTEGAEEDVGIGVRDTVKVPVFRLAGGRCGIRGYCVLGVEVT